MKKYFEPEMEIVAFDTADIVSHGDNDFSVGGWLTNDVFDGLDEFSLENQNGNDGF